ncbi:MAG TPA: hypothetical protein VM261_02385 [Kofleriaceae bacterium]|nr:hypothetical protein [Kofleriaceae bacterium]
MQRVTCAATIVVVGLSGLGGCLRDTSHVCESSGACGDDDTTDAQADDDAPGGLDARSDGSATPDGPAPMIDVGRGLDGALVISGNTDARINTCARLSGAVTAGASSLTVDLATLVPATAGTGLNGMMADRRVIVWQTAGLPAGSVTIGDQNPYTPTSGVGRYETATVTAVTLGPGTTTLTLSSPLAASYTQTAQVCRVPELTDLTVSSATGNPIAQLRPPPWNGSVGGMLAFYASGAVTIGGSGAGGTIVASGRGFREGVATNFTGAGEDCTALVGDAFSGGGSHKGEGLATALYATGLNAAANTYGLGNAVHGGGGGGCHNAGGGGGGNGGRGGRGGDQADPDALGGALGGQALLIDPRTQLVLGGGGGAGEEDDSNAGDGGLGGAVVWLRAGSLSCSSIRAAGSSGGNSSPSPRDGAGGGGGGGTIVAEIRTLGPCTFDAVGGAGGRAYIGSNSYAGGPGGGGGGGRIYLRTGTRTVEPQASVGGGAAGIVADGTGTSGATAGTAGVTCDTCLDPP